MSELIKNNLKDISVYLNVIESKKRECLRNQHKKDITQIMNEMKGYLQKINENV